MNPVVLKEYNGDQMSRKMVKGKDQSTILGLEVEEKWSPNQPYRGRNNREDQFDLEKAKEGTTTPTWKSEQDQTTGMPHEEVINNGRTRKEKERVRKGHYP
ncbi:hypothetical protein TNCV_2046401 [Trichonephila clavipes]|uniref:Uncharacterized protein n=1 Tax=Trichonephila clavipes TaxID=2585209 RepID=A0A8X6VR15_TRICX|nr:hypothetical protein TNCV_2046401 [Trichonephila clavipes]